MKYRLKDLPSMIATPIGRHKLLGGFRYRAFPLFHYLAKRHRVRAVAGTRIVAVVGSLGKTTTSRMANAALGLDRSFEPRGNTFHSLARTLREIRPGQADRVLEVGINQPGQMEPFADMIRPDVVVVTSIGSEHRNYLKTVETTRHEKAHMVRALGPDGVAALNADDEHVMWMASQTGARIITWGRAETADLRVTDEVTDFPHGTRFNLHYRSEAHECRIRLLGKPSVDAALGALAAGLAAGRRIGEMLPRLAAMPPAPSRMEPVPLPNGAYLLDDSYKLNIEAILSALETLSRCAAQRRIVLLGPLHDYLENQEHWFGEITARAHAVCDRIYIVGDAWDRYDKAAAELGLSTEKMVPIGMDFDALQVELEQRTGPGDIIIPKVHLHRVERIFLRMLGLEMNCRTPSCMHHQVCRDCPMGRRGWGHSEIVDWLL